MPFFTLQSTPPPFPTLASPPWGWRTLWTRISFSFPPRPPPPLSYLPCPLPPSGQSPFPQDFPPSTRIIPFPPFPPRTCKFLPQSPLPPRMPQPPWVCVFWIPLFPKDPSPLLPSQPAPRAPLPPPEPVRSLVISDAPVLMPPCNNPPSPRSSPTSNPLPPPLRPPSPPLNPLPMYIPHGRIRIVSQEGQRVKNCSRDFIALPPLPPLPPPVPLLQFLP